MHREGIDCYWQVVSQMEIWFLWENETEILQTIAVSVLRYGCTIWMHLMIANEMHREKKLDEYYSKILCPVLNISLKQHPTKQLLYGHFFLISETTQLRRTRHAGNCRKSNDELIIRDVVWWTPTHKHDKVGQSAKTYIHQLCADTRYILDDLLGAVGDPIYPTPPVGQDMAQCQFLSGV